MEWGAASKAGVSLVEFGVWKTPSSGTLLLDVPPTYLEGMDEFHFRGGRILVDEKKA